MTWFLQLKEVGFQPKESGIIADSDQTPREQESTERGHTWHVCSSRTEDGTKGSIDAVLSLQLNYMKKSPRPGGSMYCEWKMLLNLAPKVSWHHSKYRQNQLSVTTLSLFNFFFIFIIDNITGVPTHAPLCLYLHCSHPSFLWPLPHGCLCLWVICG